jgi:hypothetical protein
LQHHMRSQCERRALLLRMDVPLPVVYVVWTVCSSVWLKNAIVAWQLHTMLASSHIRLRYKPPTGKSVCLHAISVYVYAAFLASLGVWEPAWLPHKTNGVSGQGCIPLEFSARSTWFYFLSSCLYLQQSLFPMWCGSVTISRKRR